jgi:hypothetical protein
MFDMVQIPIGEVSEPDSEASATGIPGLWEETHRHARSVAVITVAARFRQLRFINLRLIN